MSTKRSHLSKFSIKHSEENVKISNKNIKNSLTHGLLELWKKSILCDVIVTSNGVQTAAHKIVLAVHSDYFSAMFTSGLQESSQSSPTISLQEAPPHVVKEVIQYMYTGNLQVTKENIQDFVVVSDLLQMEDLKGICCGIMENHIDITNCLGVWQFAEQFNCHTMEEKAIQIIKKQFSIVVQQEEFVSIPVEKFQTILKFDDLNLGKLGEDVVVQSLACWITANMISDNNMLKNIMKLVRWCQASHEKITEFTAMPVIEESPELKLYVEEIQRVPAPPRSSQQCIYVMGGYLQSRIGPLCPRLQSTSMYNTDTKAWTLVADLPVLPSFVFSFVLFGKLLCIAYETYKMKSEQNLKVITQDKGGVYEYNLYRNEWMDISQSFSADVLKSISEFQSYQGTCAVCADTNRLFLVTYNKVLCLQLHLNNGDIVCSDIIHLPPIIETEEQNIINMAAIVYDKVLYVIGGQRLYSHRDVETLNLMYKLDERSQTWISLCPLLEERTALAVVALDSHLYALGGWGGKNNLRLSSVERYNPSQDKWIAVASMNQYRSHLNAVVLDGKIFVMGGKSYGVAGGGVRKVLRSVEVYDREADVWTPLEQPMLQNRCMFAASVW